jgi:hypothetical protein
LRTCLPEALFLLQSSHVHANYPDIGQDDPSFRLKYSMLLLNGAQTTMATRLRATLGNLVRVLNYLL